MTKLNVSSFRPLLSRITDTPTTVVCPVIDVIDDDTLEYHYSDSKGTSVGGFDWNLQFTWHAIPENERKRRKNSAGGWRLMLFVEMWVEGEMLFDFINY